MFSLTNSIHHPFEVRFSQEWKFERVKPWTSAVLRFLSQKKALQQWDIPNSCYHAYGRNMPEIFEAKMRAPLGRAFILKEMRCTTSWPTQSSGRKPHFASLARQCSEKQEVSTGIRYTVFGFTARFFCCFTAELFVIFSHIFPVKVKWGLHDYWTAWCWEIRVHNLDSRTLSKICAYVFSHLCEHLPCVSTRWETLFRSL